MGTPNHLAPALVQSANPWDRWLGAGEPEKDRSLLDSELQELIQLSQRYDARWESKLIAIANQIAANDIDSAYHAWQVLIRPLKGGFLGFLIDAADRDKALIVNRHIEHCRHSVGEHLYTWYQSIQRSRNMDCSQGFCAQN